MSRSPLTSLTETSDLISAATLPAKRQHKQALAHAIRQVENENALLQKQYMDVLPALQTASAEISSCKALIEKVSSHVLFHIPDC